MGGLTQKGALLKLLVSPGVPKIQRLAPFDRHHPPSQEREREREVDGERERERERGGCG